MNAEFLKKKVGPLPVWGWGIIAVAGVVLILRYRAAHAATASPTTASVPFGSATGTSNGYAPSLSDQIGQLESDLSALQGLNGFLNPSGGTPPPSGTPPTTYPTAGEFLGTDGLIYNAANFWWVDGVPYPKWQFSTPPAPGSPGGVPFAEPPQGWPGPPVPGGTPSAPPVSTPTTSSGGLLSGGNPAPIQPPAQLGFPAVQQQPPTYRSAPGTGG